MGGSANLSLSIGMGINDQSSNEATRAGSCEKLMFTTLCIAAGGKGRHSSAPRPSLEGIKNVETNSGKQVNVVNGNLVGKRVVPQSSQFCAM